MAIAPSALRFHTDVELAEAEIDRQLMSMRTALGSMPLIRCEVRSTFPLRAVRSALARFERLGWETVIVSSDVSGVVVALSEISAQSVGDEVI